MNQQPYITDPEVQQVSSAARAKAFLNKVYMWLAVSMLLTAGVAAYTAIDGALATINGVKHRCIDSYVANTLTPEQQQTLVEAVNKVMAMDVTGMNGVQIANLIYKTAFGK